MMVVGVLYGADDGFQELGCSICIFNNKKKTWQLLTIRHNKGSFVIL